MSDYAPEIGPDGRPRPRFGEYATPEEQRARIQQPDASIALGAGVSPDDVAADAGAQNAAPAAPAAAAASRPVAGAPRPVDRIATIALLAYGAINVVLSVFSFFDLANVAQQALDIVGVPGEFSNFAGARLWGPIAAGVLIVGYLVTLWLSLRRLRAGKLTWWLPLVGAVATYAVVYVCLAIPLLGDPAFIDYANSLR